MKLDLPARRDGLGYEGAYGRRVPIGETQSIYSKLCSVAFEQYPPLLHRERRRLLMIQAAMIATTEGG